MFIPFSRELCVVAWQYPNGHADRREVICEIR
jgi:hypothetical protein